MQKRLFFRVFFYLCTFQGHLCVPNQLRGPSQQHRPRRPIRKQVKIDSNCLERNIFFIFTSNFQVCLPRTRTEIRFLRQGHRRSSTVRVLQETAAQGEDIQIQQL